MRIFLIDVAWRYLSAADKIGFWKWGIVDLISAIPFITGVNTKGCGIG